MTEVKLDTTEISSALKEGQDVNQILQIKKEWYDVLENLKRYLMPETMKCKEIVYSPSVWYLLKGTAGISGNKLKFSTPNKELPYDIYPDSCLKLYVTAHEAFGHSADVEEYYKNSWLEISKEQIIFVSPEQRANLRVMYLLPRIFKEAIKKEICSFLSRYVNVNLDLGEYEEVFMTIEILGESGLQRRDDVVSFFKEVKDKNGTPIERYLDKCFVYACAGLAVPPNLNCVKEYGIRTYDDLRKVCRELAKYIRGELKEPPKLVTSNDGYKPEYSVDLRWIDTNIALEELNKEISYWQNRFRRHNRFSCFQDMYESLERMYDRIKFIGL